MRSGGQPTVHDLLEQTQKMQRQVAAAQEELVGVHFSGSAGGGLVTAKVSGGGDLTALSIDPSVVDPRDTETLAELVVAAVRAAGDQARATAADRLGTVTGGLDLGF